MKVNGGVRGEHSQVLTQKIQIVSNAVRMHHAFTVLVFIFFGSFKYRHRKQFTILVFIFFAVPNRLKYHQNACFRNIVFKTISSVPNRFKYRHNSLLSLFSTTTNLHFQIVSNRVGMHALEALFSCFSCSSKSFQIPSDCMC